MINIVVYVDLCTCRNLFIYREFIGEYSMFFFLFSFWDRVFYWIYILLFYLGNLVSEVSFVCFCVFFDSLYVFFYYYISLDLDILF